MSSKTNKISVKQLIIVNILILIGLFSCFKLWQHYFASPKIPKELRGIVLPEPISLKPFRLVDHFSKPFNMERLQGSWSFVFFGYTQCPDVCPISMGLLADTFERLSKVPGVLDNTQAVFISVDPGRDTPELLKSYVPYYNPEFLGVTGTAEQLRAFAKQMLASYVISSKVDEDGDYTVAHTSAFFLVDPKGQLFAIFQSQFHDPEKMAEYFISIRTNYEK
ncbi:MAG: SCO family protein [Magnetococcales bacterium]|nr:SCO family protein [Magnetococcales bacterium]